MAGKQRDLTSEWSDWLWSDELGCKYSTRYGPAGEIEYDYLRPEEKCEEPRTAFIWDRGEQSAPSDAYTTSVPGSGYTTSSSDFEVISEPTRFFKIGRVFKALWTEPAGENLVPESPNITASPFGGNIFTKVRHFVVVREMKGCCICLSMFTYNGQGTTKKGVRPEDYAAVYADGASPQIIPGENLTKSPFPIIVETPMESVHPMSRLNFGRIYTLEHNVRVFKVGRIPDAYHKQLIDYYVSTVAGPNWTSSSSHEDLQYVRDELPMIGVQCPGGAIVMARQITADGATSNSIMKDRYVVVDERRNRKFWKPGRVFMMLWTEPARTSQGRFNTAASTASSTASSQYATVWLGEAVYSEIRRFVVIGECYGNVICSPIHTYSGMATLKHNLPDPQQHAIIYTSSFPPEEFSIKDEDGNIVREDLTKQPIRVVSELDGPDGDLGPRPRINFAKIYTVEKYVRVLNIGKGHDDSMASLLASCFFARPEDQPPQRPRKYSNKSKQKGARNGSGNDKQNSSQGYQGKES